MKGEGRADTLVLRLGQYSLFGEISHGGMASVHYGKLDSATGFQKTIAIKRLLPHVAKDPDFRDMIQEEARLVSRVRHPNVITPLDVLATEDEVLLAMEYVHGEALSRLLKSAKRAGRATPVPIAAAILSGCLHGLHAAHEAKDEQGRPLEIVHRDISPHNIIVGADGVPRVIDFGIAKGVTSRENTQVGQIKGKLPYLAPEQFGGEPATRLTDIYSMAVVAWEVLVGKRLFEAETDHAVFAKIARAPVDRPSAWVEGVPPALDELVLRGVSRDPAERPRSAKEMALAIEAIVSLAPPSAVGAWVEELAGRELAARAELIAEIERVPSSRTLPVFAKPAAMLTDVPPPSGPPAEKAGPNPPPLPPRPPPAPPLATPRPPPAPPARPPPAQARTAPLPPPPPRPTRPERASPIEIEPIATSDPHDTPRAILVAPKPPAAGALRKPDVEIPNVAWMPTPASYVAVTPGPRRVGGTVFLVVIVLIAIAGFVLALPSIVKSAYTKSLAAHGVVMEARDVTVSLHRIAFVGVTLALAEAPTVGSARAAAIEVELREGSASGVTVRGLEVALNGPVAAVRKDLAGFRQRHAARQPVADVSRTIPLAIDNARVEWRGVLGQGTLALVENLSGDAKLVTDESGIVRDAKVRAEIFKLGTAVGPSGTQVGPWQLEIASDDSGSRAALHLSPNAGRDARIDLAETRDGSYTVSVDLPGVKAKDAQLVILPPELVLDLKGQIALAAKGDTRGELNGRLGGEMARLGVAGASMERVAIGGVFGAAKVLGSVGLFEDRVEINLTGGCDRSGPALAATLDSRKLAQAEITIAPALARCGRR